MNIAGMKVRIQIQKNETVIDAIGNHKNAWLDYFTCWASVYQGRTASEEETAGHITEDARMDFTVRWSSETARIDSVHYRVVLDSAIYNIVTIDEQGFRKKSRKLICERAER